jgi:hypothetical protein
MTAIPEDAIKAAAQVFANWVNSPAVLGPTDEERHVVTAIMEVAAPLLVPDAVKSAAREERERIAKLAEDRDATAWNAPLDAPGCSRVPFADLIRSGQP